MRIIYESKRKKNGEIFEVETLGVVSVEGSYSASEETKKLCASS